MADESTADDGMNIGYGAALEDTGDAEAPASTPLPQAQAQPLADAPPTDAQAAAEAAPEIPADVLESSWYKALQEKATLADELTPFKSVIDGLRTEGVTSADALAQRQADAERQQAEQTRQTEEWNRVYTAHAEQVFAALKADDDFSHMSDERLSEIAWSQAHAPAAQEFSQIVAQTQQQTAQAQANQAAYRTDRDGFLSDDRYKVGGEPLPAKFVDAMALQANPRNRAELEQVVADAHREYNNHFNHLLSKHIEQEAKKQQATRPLPRASGAPPAGAAISENIGFEQATALEIANAA